MKKFLVLFECGKNNTTNEKCIYIEKHSVLIEAANKEACFHKFRRGYEINEGSGIFSSYAGFWFGHKHNWDYVQVTEIKDL